MNNSGQVSVELKLLLDKLRRDAKQAADIIREALKSGTTSSDAGLDRANEKMENLNKRTKKVTASLKEQKDAALAAWRASIPKPVVTLADEVRKYGKAGPGAFVGPVTGGGLATQPGATPKQSAKLPPGFTPLNAPPLPGVRSVAPAVNAQPQIQAQSRLTVAAKIGAVLAGFRVAVGFVSYGLNALAAPLRVAAEAAESARRIYARQLTSGMGAISTRHSIIAEALGVSEQSVIQYGEAFKRLNSRMDYSIKSITENTPALTTTGWRVKELQSNLMAASMEFARAMKGVIDTLLDGANLLAKSVAGSIKAARENYINAQFAMKYGLSSGSGAGPDGKMRQMFFRDGKYVGDELNEKLKKQAKKESESAEDRAPKPISSMNRLAASAWEKMGLVLGSGGANHAQQTAANTKRIASLMDRMVGLLTRPGEDIKNEYNYSRP